MNTKNNNKFKDKTTIKKHPNKKYNKFLIIMEIIIIILLKLIMQKIFVFKRETMKIFIS